MRKKLPLPRNAFCADKIFRFFLRSGALILRDIYSLTVTRHLRIHENAVHGNGLPWK